MAKSIIGHDDRQDVIRMIDTSGLTLMRVNPILQKRFIAGTWQIKGIDTKKFNPFPGAQTKHFFGENMSEPKHQYKLIILYDNGKKFTVSQVVSHGFKYGPDQKTRDLLIYSRYDSRSKVRSDFRVPATDMAAITVKKPNSVFTERFKPCAVISGGAEKKANNHQQLQKVKKQNVKKGKGNKGEKANAETASKPVKARSRIANRQSDTGQSNVQHPAQSD